MIYLTTVPVAYVASIARIGKDAEGSGRGRRLRSRLQYATSRKVVGSSPDDMDFSMDLGSTQPLTELGTRTFPGGNGGRHVRLTISPPSVKPTPRKFWGHQLVTTLWTSAFG
jgi:hypothetical protein